MAFSKQRSTCNFGKGMVMRMRGPALKNQQGVSWRGISNPFSVTGEYEQYTGIVNVVWATQQWEASDPRRDLYLGKKQDDKRCIFFPFQP